MHMKAGFACFLRFAATASFTRIGLQRAPQLTVALSRELAMTVTEAESNVAASVEMALKDALGPVGLHALPQKVPELKAWCVTERIRPLALLQLFPEAFVVEPTTSDVSLLCVRLAHGGSPAVGTAAMVDDGTPSMDASGVADMLGERLGTTLSKYHAHRPSLPTDPVPLSWLVRSMPSPIEALVIAAPEREWFFHLDPARFGYKDRACAWSACRDAHLRRFVDSRQEQFTWHERDDGTPAISMTLAEVSRRRGCSAAESAISMAEIARARHGVLTGLSRAQRKAATATAAMASPDPLPSPAVGSRLYLVRGSARTVSLLDEEMRSAAEYAGLAPELLRPLTPGLWLQVRGTDGGGPAAMRMATLLPHLAAVRGGGTLLLGASTAAAMVQLLRGARDCDSLCRRVFRQGPWFCPPENDKDEQDGRAGSDQDGPRRTGGAQDGAIRAGGAHGWTLHVEQHYPPADQRVLPFHCLDDVGELCVALSRALDRGALGVDEETESPSLVPDGVAHLTLLVTKGTVLLLREDDPAPPKVRVDEGVAEGELPSSRDQLRLPRWISAWDRRAFFFSAALDPIVAQASLNIALHTHLKLHPDQTLPSDVHSADPSDTLRVFDPCLGSGTILAAAAARGIRRIVGADINAEFVARARSNLLDARLLGSGVRLFVHDAATPYLAEDLDPLSHSQLDPGSLSSHSQLDPGSLSQTLVVSNPPWGNNIGEGLDGKAIVTSVTSQFAGATMCWIANPLAVEALRCLPGVTVLRHVPFGSVELVVCTASRF